MHERQRDFAASDTDNTPNMGDNAAKIIDYRACVALVRPALHPMREIHAKEAQRRALLLSALFTRQPPIKDHKKIHKRQHNFQIMNENVNNDTLCLLILTIDF